jgi:Dynein heavy chain, N-terminal region 2
MMGVIQRALGEYLAKQRSDCSHFYFLGDDFLLEIMGSSGEPGKVLAHIGKMFGGIGGARLAHEILLLGTYSMMKQPALHGPMWAKREKPSGGK